MKPQRERALIWLTIIASLIAVRIIGVKILLVIGSVILYRTGEKSVQRLVILFWLLMIPTWILSHYIPIPLAGLIVYGVPWVIYVIYQHVRK